MFAFCPAPTMIGLLPQFVYLNYPFPLISVLEFGLSFTLILHVFFNPILLSSWCKDSRSSTWVFLHHFNPKVSRTSGERGLVHTSLFSVVLGKDSTSFSSPLLAVFFFFFPSTHGFPFFLFSFPPLSTYV